MTEEKVSLRDVVFDKMNVLENHFIRGDHLDPKYRDTIKDQMAWIKKMWIVVGDDDKAVSYTHLTLPTICSV